MLRRIQKAKGIAEPKDLIPVQKEIRALEATGVAASNILKAI